MVCGVSSSVGCDCFGNLIFFATPHTPPLMLTREIAQWKTYALLDSGDGEKSERFGDVVMVRPDPQAIWKKADARASCWIDAHITYARQGREGEWTYRKPLPDAWTIAWNELVFRIRPTSFKHTGLFPEQANNWQYITQTVQAGMRVLNLFGYTGGASIAAASVGADVTHVDASKPVVTWTRENAALSGLADAPLRYIVDDAQKFLAREVRRQSRYDAIFMDPPAFGRGPEGEIWKFEEHLPQLLEQCVQLLNKEHGILLVNAYSLGYPALAIENMIKSVLPWEVEMTSVELTLQEQNARGFLLPTGIVVRVTW